MKKLMLTTAIVAVTSFGAVAQTTTATTEPAAQGQMQGQANVPAFLASDFTGMRLYTLDHESVSDLLARERTETDMQSGETGDAYQNRSVRWTSSDAFIGQRDAWENIGNVDDVVMTQDGEIRGILVDVGGFLGMFAHTVMVDIDDLYFVSEDATTTTTDIAEDVSDFFVVATMSREQLEALPEWDESLLSSGFEAARYGQQPGMSETGEAPAQEQAEMMEPGNAQTTMEDGSQTGMSDDMTAQGYAEIDVHDERTADMLTGANVYDAAQENIGNVADLVLGNDNAVTHMLVDVGGFLGMGSHTVAMPVEEANILWHEADEDVRVHVDMTRDQLETMPEYEG